MNPLPGIPSQRPVAILGAGLSGLSAAWYLQRAGHPIVVFEKVLQPGGAIGGVRHEGWFHEGGPNSLFESSPEITSFVDDLGLRPRCLYAPKAAKKRYIVRKGRPIALPNSPLAFVGNGLLSWRAKLNILGEPFRPPSAADAEETVEQFVSRRLGSEFLDYVVNPFVAGVYAGDPRRLSVRHAFPKLHALEQENGSLIRGAIKRRNPSGAPRGGMLSFPDGLEEIPRAIAHTLGDAVRLGCEVLAISRVDDSWIIEYETGGVRCQETFSAVICTLPADVLGRIPFSGVPEAHELEQFRSLEHPPVVSVFTGYRREDVAHPLDGFGLLVPEVEHRQILGTLFSSTLFPGRAPDGHVALTTFVGGMRQPALPKLSDKEIVELVQVELRSLLGIRGDIVYLSLRRWSRAIPQYNLGFEKLISACQSVEAASPTLFIGGNCRDGISLANCIDGGRRLAARVGLALCAVADAKE